MDAIEVDEDIKLQKHATELIAEFERTLPRFLRKPDGDGGFRVRSRVRARELYRLLNRLIEPFQELPQLLDRHLPVVIPMVANTYLEHLQNRRPDKAVYTRSNLLQPIGTAIGWILYTLCKVRGEKVVVRFLNVETKYLELLLSALEEAERNKPQGSVNYDWHERYIVLLWLSHLLLAPFDLASISSADLEDSVLPEIPGLRWPENLPSIAVKILPLAIKYLASPGKERDAAKSLLVRISMRRDMQELGLLETLVRWSVSALNPPADTTVESPYYYMGIMGYLAGILRASADTSDLDRYLPTIFHAAHTLAAGDSPVSKSTVSLASARKLLIKIIRSVSLLVLHRPPSNGAATEVIESSIAYLLENLADNDTPVRLAASKGLSMIALRLDSDMAAQVIEAVLESLDRNILWVKVEGKRTRDLSGVDPLEWHGLMLTLAHLLYRRSPPASQLSDVIHALLLGLSFERRSPSGVSVGTNVRDAACFGIWALSRRYTTQELLAVPVTSTLAGATSSSASSILQVLATQLVVTASLDPTGNLRRGSSAALQELIGRHPDTVEQGIWVVQTVDYHAVALRSRAIREVALKATKLSGQYGEAILEGLRGWRGVGDADAAARRVAGATSGALTLELSRLYSSEPLDRFLPYMDLITRHLRTLQDRQTEERHGLLLCFAALLDTFPILVADIKLGEMDVNKTRGVLHHTIREVTGILENCKTASYRKPELVAEAASRLVVSSVPILQAAILFEEHTSPPRDVALHPGSEVVSPGNAAVLPQLISMVDSCKPADEVRRLVAVLNDAHKQWLDLNEKSSITAVSEATLVLLVFSKATDREQTIRRWAEIARHRPSSRSNLNHSYFFALTMAHPVAASIPSLTSERDVDLICETVLERWAGDVDIDTRVSILQSLTQADILRQRPMVFLDVISDGLNDYTTNARGDVGSHVRLESLKATKKLWTHLASATAEDEWLRTVADRLFLRVLRLAVEKLDRVRMEAQSTLALTLRSNFVSRYNYLGFSSKRYFHTILQLLSRDFLHPLISDSVKSDTESWMTELLAGFVTSADAGSEDIVIASRAALCDHCKGSAENLASVCRALVLNLKTRQGQDRVVVPTLEIIAFLMHVGLFQQCKDIDMRNLCLQVQKAGYKTGNVRKLEACIRVYGGIAGMDDEAVGDATSEALTAKRREGVAEAKKRLGALMFHPWPKIRSQVVDEIWALHADTEVGMKLMGVDWGSAGKASITSVVASLGLN